MALAEMLRASDQALDPGGKALGLPGPDLIEIERADYVLASSCTHSPFFAMRAVFRGDLRGLPLFRCSADLRRLLNHCDSNHRQGAADAPKSHAEHLAGNLRPAVLSGRAELR